MISRSIRMYDYQWKAAKKIAKRAKTSLSGIYRELVDKSLEAVSRK